MKSPTLRYDREANALYIQFSAEDVVNTVELSETVYVDMDIHDEPVGFEILNADPLMLNSIPPLPDTAALRDLIHNSK